ncbi:MAG: MarR family transcriptional regulator [Ancalomicrobiaceae bacterium]|nr:MarR family transcriptional regulator [Ancalomicrobiaceae bacterium]
MPSDGERFDELYRLIYARAVRHVPDKRAWLTPESRWVLDHMAEAGPLTIGEMAATFDRAQSTITEMVDGLCRQNLLERMPDARDRRRTLVWLTDAAFERLKLEREVLDVAVLDRALAKMPAADRERLYALIEDLNRHLGDRDDDHHL